MAPLVSVIVPTKNDARTIAAALESIRAQSYSHIELIVVDNTSSDDTAELAMRYADYVFQRGPERSAQRNFGGTVARGEYLLFVDADMRLSSDVVSQCVAGVQSGSADAFVVPERSFGQGYWAECKALERACYDGDLTIEAARFIPKQLFLRVGKFDENITGFEDWDLSRRLAAEAKIGRITALIGHDEGRLTFARSVGKKSYYARFFLRYARRHKLPLGVSTPLRVAFLRNWRALIRRPHITAGMLLLKTAEMGAASFVIAAQLIGARRP